MAITAFIISLISFAISALGYYRTHHHVSKKLYAFVTLTPDVLRNYKVPFTLVNAGTSDVVLLGYSLARKLANGQGSMSTSSEHVSFEDAFNGLLNPGNASICKVNIVPEYSENDIFNCGKELGNGKKEITYQLTFTWCDSTGRQYDSSIDLFSVSVNAEGELSSIHPNNDSENNLYKKTEK